MRSTLPVVALAYFAGVGLSLAGSPLRGAPGLGVLALAIGIGLAAATRGARQRAGRLGLLVLGLGALAAGHLGLPAPAASAAARGGTFRAFGVVEEVVHRARGPDAFLRLTGAEAMGGAESLGPGICARVYGLDAPPGSRVAAILRLHPVARFANPTPHPRWPSARDCPMGGAVRGEVLVEAAAPLPSRVTHGVAAHLRSALATTLGPSSSSVARALLLGDRTLEAEARERVASAGLAHVLAVSGLHVTLLAGAVLLGVRWGLLRLGIAARGVDPVRVAPAVAIPVALAFAALVGSAPSAWRAAFTASLAWSAHAAGRRPDALSTAAAAALVSAALRPGDVGRPAFALSVLATVALVTATGPRRGALVDGWRASVRTMLGTGPVLLWCFRGLPLAGVVANLVAVPFAAAVLLPLTVVHGLLASVVPSVAAGTTAPALDAAVGVFFAVSDLFATGRLGAALPPLDPLQGVAVVGVCLAGLAPLALPRRAALAALSLLLLAGAEVHLRQREMPRGGLRVTFLDVGQGDAALVDLPDGRLLVVDAGGAPGGGPDPGARVLVPLLQARRRSAVGLFVLSHPHPDHYQGLSALLEAFPVREVWDSGQGAAEAPEGEVAALLGRARSRGARLRTPRSLCGRAHRFGGATLRLHHPCPGYDPGYGPNDNSMALELSLGRRRVLFLGDVEGHGEATLRGRVGPVDVLKVAHHGSRTSSHPALLRELRPTVAVVSAGRANRFGHPHPPVWRRLRRVAPCAYRTDRHGGVTVETDGENLRVWSVSGPRCRIEGTRE